MSTEERNELLNFVEGLNKNSLADVVADLRNPSFPLDAYKKLTEAQWEKLYGSAGIDIFNHLNPGNIILIQLDK